jgi:hypothetical protein
MNAHEIKKVKTSSWQSDRWYDADFNRSWGVMTMVVIVVLGVWTLSIIWYSKQKPKPMLKGSVGGILLWVLLGFVHCVVFGTEHGVLETESVFFYTDWD